MATSVSLLDSLEIHHVFVSKNTGGNVVCSGNVHIWPCFCDLGHLNYRIQLANESGRSTFTKT